MKRTDIHRPSAIVPDDYDDVGFLPKVEFDNFEFVRMERQRINKHMERNGGHWEHPSSGSCAVCGNVQAETHIVFWHRPTNAYIKVGETCADKLNFSRGVKFNEFRSKMKAARKSAVEALKLKAGKLKAAALLAEWKMKAAWVIYETGYSLENQWAENTVIDIVVKLIRYGSVSDKQQAFIRKLLEQIDNRATVEAQRKVETAAAAPAPVTDERIWIEGEIIAIKKQESDYGWVIKLLIKTSTGWKAWGTCPSILNDAELAKGQHVGFMARFQRSDDDPKFGFFSRPTKAEFLETIRSTT